MHSLSAKRKILDYEVEKDLEKPHKNKQNKFSAYFTEQKPRKSALSYKTLTEESTDSLFQTSPVVISNIRYIRYKTSLNKQILRSSF